MTDGASPVKSTIPEWIYRGGIALAVVVIGYFLKDIHKDFDDLKKDISDYQSTKAMIVRVEAEQQRRGDRFEIIVQAVAVIKAQLERAEIDRVAMQRQLDRIERRGTEDRR